MTNTGKRRPNRGWRGSITSISVAASALGLSNGVVSCGIVQACASPGLADASWAVRPCPGSSAALVRGRGGELHRDAQPPCGPRGEGEGAVVGLGDALHDGQAEADPGVVG